MRFIGKLGGEQYASGLTYGANGAMLGAVWNGTGTSRLVEVRSYNWLGQLLTAEVKKGGTDLKWRITNQYGNENNNGNLNKQFTETGLATYGVKYAYDQVNRIRGALENAANEGLLQDQSCSVVGGTWCVKYRADGYGNLWTENKSATAAGVAAMSQSAYNAATNRMTAASYYANGNQKNWALNAPKSRAEYDAEGKMVKAGRVTENDGTVWDAAQALTTLTYNGMGQRVKKTVTQGASTSTVHYVYGLDGEVASEWESAPTSVNGRQYLVADHLGSTRVRLDANGEVVQRIDYEPFGTEVERTGVSGYVGGNAVARKFTGKERDTETGLDYFGARYMGSGLGRFTTPDPLDSSGYPAFPSSWNRFSYTHNRPNTFVDPDGLDIKPVVIDRQGGRASVAFIDSSVQDQFEAFTSEINSDGSTITYNYLFRSTNEQARFYADRANNSNPVAKPVSSPHESGLAFDFNRSSALSAQYSLEDLRQDAITHGFEPIIGGGDPPHLQSTLINLGRWSPWAKNRVSYLRKRNQGLYSRYERMAKSMFGANWAGSTTREEADRRANLLTAFYYLYLACLSDERFVVESTIKFQ